MANNSKILKLKGEIAKIKSDIAKEQAKISPLKKKIISAEESIRKTKSASTAKSKLNDINRAENAIATIEKKIGDLQKKEAKKEAELKSAEKAYQNEVDKENKKKLKEDKKLQTEHDRQMRSVSSTLQQHTYRQDAFEKELAQLTALPQKITVLFMASNPKGTGHLRLDEEARNIQERIRLSEYRDSIIFETRWATRASDILQAINGTNPTIIHFSGHGATTGELVLENPDGSSKLVSKEAITAAITTASDTVKLVLFNACFSQSQAENIVQNISSAIGMSTSIGDAAACVFAAHFYSSIGFGHSLQKAFNQAKAALLLEGIHEDSTPQLFVQDGLSADELYFVDSN